MRRTVRKRAQALVLLLTSLSTTLAADTPGDGLELEALPYPGPSVTVTLESGEFIAFDGESLDRYDADGLLVTNLATLPAFGFPSFLLVDETESFLVLGESTTGVIYTAGLSPSGPNPVTTLQLNYAAAFEDADHILVSAASRGIGMGNQIFRVDLSTGLTTELCDVAGASGPVAVDADGSLLYGTVTDAWPQPAGSSSLLRWSAAQLTGMPVLTEADAVIVESGLDGAASLAVDPVRGGVYLAENNFASGLNRIRRLGDGTSSILLEGAAFQTISNLEFVRGDGVATLLPYQPATGGTLLYSTTDFASVFARRALRPRRPVLALSGIGTTGPGNFDLTLAEAPPSGFGLVFHDLSAQVPGSEYSLELSFPLVLGLSLGGVARVPGIVPVDGAGQAVVGYVNPGGLEGLISIQVLLFDAGARLVGSSNVSPL